MPKPPRGQPIRPKMTHVDRPEISETFADSCAGLTVEGLNAKLEFVVNRMDDPKPPTPPSGKAVTTCRLILPIPGLVDLHAKISQILGALQKQGVIQVTPAPIAQGSQSGKPN
jgi:hypothetical protein